MNKSLEYLILNDEFFDTFSVIDDMENDLRSLDTSEPAARKYFKYNEDDILEILTEYIAKDSSAKLLVDEDDNVRLIAVIGDLDELDKKINYNGYTQISSACVDLIVHKTVLL